MSIDNDSDFKLTIQTGGSLLFEKTGVVPEFLIFSSAKLNRTWRLKLKKKEQNGILKVNGQIAFYYFFDGLICKIKTINDGKVTKEWKIEEIIMALSD
jgi:hypothetical protein